MEHPQNRVREAARMIAVREIRSQDPRYPTRLIAAALGVHIRTAQRYVKALPLVEEYLAQLRGQR